MKWKNKTHELDDINNKILMDAQNYHHIYIFGAGSMGRKLMITLQMYGILEGFIDNDICKQRIGFKSVTIYSLDEYMKVKRGLIVIAVNEKNMSDIIKQLENVCLIEGKDFISYKNFCSELFPIISMSLFNKNFVQLAQISLTERCSLKCKKCAHGCFAVDNTKTIDLTLAQVYRSADTFFHNVDFIQEFVLIGGEPLLYKELSDVIKYIGKRYRHQIGIFSITTNGTIVPKHEIIEVCKEYNVFFHISNYSSTIPNLKDSYTIITDLLERQGINYQISNEEGEWMDYGFDYVDRNAGENELIQVFDACRTPCREVRENRFYYCVMARSVSENMGFNVGEDDYLDLDKLHGEQGRKELLEFNLGYSDKGYLDMCNYCHGAESVNYPIPVAEQEENHE